MSNCGYISEEEHRRIYEACPVQFGDVLLTKDGASVGNVCRNTLKEPFSLLSSVAVLRGVPQQLDNEFLLQFLMSPLGQSAIRSEVAGQAITRITLNTISQLRVPLPPLAEQKAIAAVLSAWDGAIGQTAALITVKQRLKQGLMQQLLSGKRRLRKFRDKWRSCHLGDVFSDRREAGYDGLPMLSVTLDVGIVRRDSRDRPVRTSLDHDEHLLVRKGDIAYNMMRMWQGGCGMANEDGVVSPSYVVCQPNEKIDSRYADHLFHTPRMIFLFWAYSYGLTDDRRRLYFDGFSKIPVQLPSVAEQRKIADIIDRLDGELGLLRKKRDSLGVQKRGLMQQLLTGKIRVSDSLLKKRAKS